MLSKESAICRGILSVYLEIKAHDIEDQDIKDLLFEYAEDEDVYGTDIFVDFLKKKGIDIDYRCNYPSEEIQDELDANNISIVSIFTIRALSPYENDLLFYKFIRDHVEVLAGGLYGSAIELKYLPSYDYIDSHIEGAKEFIEQASTFMITTTEWGITNFELVTDFLLSLDNSINHIKLFIKDQSSYYERRETVA